MQTMEQPTTLKLRRKVNGDFAEWLVTPAVLQRRIQQPNWPVADLEVFSASTGLWRPLSASPDSPDIPFHELLDASITSLNEGNDALAKLFAMRIRGLDPDEREEQTSSACLILGTLELDSRSPCSRAFFDRATHGPALVRAAAFNNLGVADIVLSRDVVAAEHDFAQAIAADPDFLPPHVNLVRLRDALAHEGAEPFAGKPWKTLRDEALARVRQLVFDGAARRFLNSTFPGKSVVRLLPTSFGPRPLGLRIPRSDLGIPAALELLAGAVEAEIEGRLDSAIELADSAAAESKAIGPSAQALKTAASQELERRRKAEVARERRLRLAKFDNDLRAGDWESATESLAALSHLVSEAESAALAKRKDLALGGRYKAIAEHAADTQQAGRLYAMAAQCLDGKEAGTCANLANLVTLRANRRHLREACEVGRPIEAAKSLMRLSRRGALPMLLDAARKLMSALARVRDEMPPAARSEALLARGESLLSQGRMEDARRAVSELRILAPADTHVTELERRIAAAEHLQGCVGLERAGKEKQAMTHLDQCLELEPGNVNAIALLADRELGKKFGPDTAKYFFIKLRVQSALEALRSGSSDELAKALETLKDVSHTRFYALLAEGRSAQT